MMGMTELEQAAERLEQAISRLEAASRRVTERKPPTKAAAPADDTAAAIASRLDDAILRIDRLLEN
jgi:hypothetical protein